MAIKVIAQRREVKLGKNPGMKFVMRPDLYIPIQEKKVSQQGTGYFVTCHRLLCDMSQIILTPLMCHKKAERLRSG